ncbi:hypothetical protein QOZ80_9AG0690900 [Eleusine coracana subsp. coracana]|nr:hypothetical protein QOZ80_9AG0690900 [Eleusine coracana subsp. coracana]
MRFGPSTTWPPATAEDEPLYEVPSYLFRCAALRSLRIGPCWLDTPAARAAITLPSLDTLLLVGVADDATTTKRLVSGCPRLADLELDACANITKLSVPGTTRLRRLVLRNCHAMASIVAPDLSELRVFEYHDAVPPPSFQRLKHCPSSMTSCNVDFYYGGGKDEPASDPEKLASLQDFFHLFSGTTRLLQLNSARFGAGIDHNIFSASPALPVFANLRELELARILADDDTAAVSKVIRVLERTPNLEILSLFFMPPVPSLNAGDETCYGITEDKLNEHHLKYDRYAELGVPGDGTEMIPPPCLRTQTKEINLVHYQGLVAQRMLARFLLCNAPGVNEVCCAFAKGPLTMQTQLMEEVRGWVVNTSANMVFL